MGSYAHQVQKSLLSLKNDTKAEQLQRFFKTGKGEYGEGDCFLGVTMPQVRSLAKEYYKKLDYNDFDLLLNSKWHEIRMCALVCMVYSYNVSDDKNQKNIYNIYYKQIGKAINNWDLVDVTAPNIVGRYIYTNNDAKVYNKLLKGGLWHKRVAIISTFYFLKKGNTAPTYDLACQLVYQQHDLLQKAVGWSVRELGKVDLALLLKFLDKYASTMPRTALRYSLEKLTPEQKYYYMNLKNA